MSDYRERAIYEAADLRLKLLKLQDFINIPDFDALQEQERQLLSRQCDLMNEYLTVLESRINTFYVTT